MDKQNNSDSINNANESAKSEQQPSLVPVVVIEDVTTN